MPHVLFDEKWLREYSQRTGIKVPEIEEGSQARKGACLPGERQATREQPGNMERWPASPVRGGRRGKKQFAQEHDINIEQDAMTPEQFMELTRDAYGGSVIRKLLEEWKQEQS